MLIEFPSLNRRVEKGIKITIKCEILKRNTDGEQKHALKC